MKFKKNQRKHWTSVEDNAVMTLISQDVQWNSIEERLQEDYGITWRSVKQCRERWNNHLDPALVKSPWSVQEKLTLLKNHKRYGNTWAQIGQFLPGRSENAIKNQFYCCFRREFKKWKGVAPTRSQIKKYDLMLTKQMIAGFTRRVKALEEQGRRTEELDPVESDTTRENDCFLDLFADLF